MELAEHIDTINRQLRETFGIDTMSGNVMFRVVWSNDQFEKVHGLFNDYDKNDNLIRSVTETRLVPKYIQNKDRYVLERLCIVPDHQVDDLAGLKSSYEPLYVCQNIDTEEYLPPKFEYLKFIINTVLEAQHRPKGFKRYLESQAAAFGFLGGQNKEERLKKIKEEMFGNETPITDALMAQRGVSMSGLDGKSAILGNKGIILTDGDK